MLRCLVNRTARTRLYSVEQCLSLAINMLNGLFRHLTWRDTAISMLTLSDRGFKLGDNWDRKVIWVNLILFSEARKEGCKKTLNVCLRVLNFTCGCMASLLIGLSMVFAFTSPKFKTFET